MSDSQHNPPADEDSQRLEQLVAWLDSELEEEQTQDVELQLRKDTDLRQEAEELERAWGMLDTLEPVSADHQFTVQTIQAVFSESSGLAVPRRTRFTTGGLSLAAAVRIGIWFLIGFAGTLLGLQAAYLMTPASDATPDARIIQNLDLLSRYPEYSAMRNIGLLRQLQARPGEETSSHLGNVPETGDPTNVEDGGEGIRP